MISGLVGTLHYSMVLNAVLYSLSLMEDLLMPNKNQYLHNIFAVCFKRFFFSLLRYEAC